MAAPIAVAAGEIPVAASEPSVAASETPVVASTSVVAAPVVKFLGIVPYEPTWRAMQRFTDERSPTTADEIWMVEHPPVFTLGMNGSREHVLAPGDIPVIDIDRGGQVTYHGPGQLVVYPLIDIRRHGIGVRQLVVALEKAIIAYVGELGVDAVGSRDFALDYLAAATIAATHLSRLSEEIVLWMSPSFGFISLSDAFTTGSSIMPQKRNPDAAELVRGKTGRILGSFVALATVMKGLALAYAKDLQEDKEAVFTAADALDLSLAAMAGMIEDMHANDMAMRRAAETGYPTATDLADWLVRVKGKPFREAHHIAGAAVKRAEALGVALDKLPLAEMQKIEPAITAEVYSVLSLEASVNARLSFGGTAPERVREQILFWRERLA